MPDVVVDKVHNLGFDEAMARFLPIQEELERKYKVLMVWNGRRAEVRGFGINGEAWIDDVRIGVNLDLNPLLRPLAGKFKQIIETSMEETIEGKPFAL